MSTHTYCIIDDNDLARQSLQSIITEHLPDLELIGEADSVVSGAKLLRQRIPDILFLDIHLGDGDGFDILDIMPDTGARVIFTTASEQHALQAFRYAAIDYLLKPIQADAITEAVTKALQISGYSQSQHEMLQSSGEETVPQRLALHTTTEIRIVEIADIQRLEASGNYTQFFFVDGSKLLVSRTLKEYDTTLSGAGFMRTHQSHLINSSQVKAYVKTEGGYIEMKDGSIIPVSVRKKSAIMASLSNL